MGNQIATPGGPTDPQADDRLEAGGGLYLWDVVWSFDAREALDALPAWIDAVARPDGEGFTRGDFETHVREEFSTYAWVLEGMLTRAGLEVVSTDYPTPWHGELLARKP